MWIAFLDKIINVFPWKQVICCPLFFCRRGFLTHRILIITLKASNGWSRSILCGKLRRKKQLLFPLISLPEKILSSTTSVVSMAAIFFTGYLLWTWIECTNFYFEIEEAEDDKQYGVSKKNRPLPIVEMGLFMDRDGIPIAFSINPGNRNEQQSLIPLENILTR